MAIPEEDGDFLLKFAKDILGKAVRGEKLAVPMHPESLDEKLGIFCTIFSGGDLRGRGCAGVPAFAGAIENAMEAVKAAALEDPRFPPVSVNELDGLGMEICIFGEPKRILVPQQEMVVNAIAMDEGLLLKYGPYESLFPPQVWKSIPSREMFLDTLCLSAGLAEGMWKEPGAELYRLPAQVFSG
jgi:AmmeMemoRadiSam system protein A